MECRSPGGWALHRTMAAGRRGWASTMGDAGRKKKAARRRLELQGGWKLVGGFRKRHLVVRNELADGVCLVQQPQPLASMQAHREPPQPVG